MVNSVMLRDSPVVLSKDFSRFHKSVKLGTLVQFGALNIFRYGGITKPFVYEP